MRVLEIVQRHIRQHSQKYLGGHVFSATALLIGTATVLAPQTAQARFVTPTSETVVIHPLLAETDSSERLTDGVYLFGEKPLPDQLQTAYMVFEAQAGRVVGAFYSPHSSFDCFQGEVRNTELSLSITETYSQEEYAYSLGLADTAIAGVASSQFAIEGFYQLDAVSDNDLRMLGTCQTQYSGHMI